MQAIKQTVIVLSVSRYQILTESTGEVNEGTTVRFIYSDNMGPSTQDDNLKGYRPGKASLAYADFEKFPEAPALYSCDVTLKVGSDGKATAQASNFEYIKPYGVK